MKQITCILCLVVCIVLAAVPSLAQPSEVLWARTFGGPSDEYCYSVQQTTDDGFIIVGRTRSIGEGGYDAWLIKTDSDGNELWSRTFGGIESDRGNSVQQTTDGGYIITGSTASFGLDSGEVWLIKTDSLGIEEWSQTIGGTNGDGGNRVRETIDGGYIILGETFSYGNGGSDMWLIKTDSDGNIEWDQTFGISAYDHAEDLDLTLDGGFIIVGYVSQGDLGTSAWLIKVDSEGNEVWSQQKHGIESARGYCVTATVDGGFTLSGYTYADLEGSFGWLHKTDANGNEIWERTYGEWSMIESGMSIRQTDDGGYIVVGQTGYGGDTNRDVRVTKTDSVGNILWYQTYAGAEDDFGMSIQQTSDGGYVVAGYTFSYSPIYTDIFLLRLESDGSPSPVSLSLTPESDDINIPADGGSFSFDVESTNTLMDPIIGQIWTAVTLPSGRTYSGPPLLRVSLIFQPGITITASGIVQDIPAFAPAGNYTYKACVGIFTNTIYAQDSFEFEKLVVAAATNHNDQGWTTSGWNLEENQTAKNALPNEYTIESIFPNPFNPTTTVSMSLPVDSNLNVRVFNTVGQEVTVLADDRFAAGRHQFSFDGSGLSSGIYFVHASVPGEFSKMQKVVLMK
jgi:Secretion system C-terminal sorting domain